MTELSGLPKLIIKKNQVEANIKAILAKTDNDDIAFTPHFKTHQSLDIAKIFSELGVREIKVSSVEMAEFFAEIGWENITIAFPFYRQMLPHSKRLAQRCNISLFVNSTEVADFLSEQADETYSCYIEIDSGYGQAV